MDGWGLMRLSDFDGEDSKVIVVLRFQIVHFVRSSGLCGQNSHGMNFLSCRGVHSPKPMMRIAYSPYFPKNYKFPTYLHKIYKFPPIFVKLMFFCLIYVFCLPLYASCFTRSGCSY